jgi:hypothetical protein
MSVGIILHIGGRGKQVEMVLLNNRIVKNSANILFTLFSYLCCSAYSFEGI